jgi:hypothetical protein
MIIYELAGSEREALLLAGDGYGHKTEETAREALKNIIDSRILPPELQSHSERLKLFEIRVEERSL